MLRKLIAYDFKALAKNLFPVYGLMFALMAVFTIMIRFRVEEGFLFGLTVFLLLVPAPQPVPPSALQQP